MQPTPTILVSTTPIYDEQAYLKYAREQIALGLYATPPTIPVAKPWCERFAKCYSNSTEDPQHFVQFTHFPVFDCPHGDKCTNGHVDHRNKFRHVLLPLCKLGSKCTLGHTNYRHCNEVAICEYGVKCVKPNCPYDHTEKRPLCRFMPCTKRNDSHHEQTYRHLTVPNCPDKECKSMSVSHYREFHHATVRPCPYGEKCLIAPKAPEHKKLFHAQTCETKMSSSTSSIDRLLTESTSSNNRLAESE